MVAYAIRPLLCLLTTLHPTRSHSILRTQPYPSQGFYFLRASEASRNFLRALQRSYADPATPASTTEQPLFNRALVSSAGSAGKLRWQLLPLQLFTNGWAYRGRLVRPQASGAPFIAHHNWMAGSAAKRRRMGDWAMWALEDRNGTDLPTCRDGYAEAAAAMARNAAKHYHRKG